MNEEEHEMASNSQSGSDILSSIVWKTFMGQGLTSTQDMVYDFHIEIDMTECKWKEEEIRDALEVVAKKLHNHEPIGCVALPFIHNKGDENYYDPVWKYPPYVLPPEAQKILGIQENATIET